MNTKLEKISTDKIDVVSSFNIREEFGTAETEDLQESIKNTQGNIQPVLVVKNGNRYQLISGERRFNAINKTGMKEILCLVYDSLTEEEKTKLMFNENLGRKNLTWIEELKGIKRLKELGCDITVEVLARQKNIPESKAWNLLEALKAIEEFPQLAEERTRRSVIDKYKELQKLDYEKLEAVRDQQITVKQALTRESIRKNMDSGKIVIEELKDEVEHYKTKFKDIYKTIVDLDKEQRIENGVWLKNEVKQIVEASRQCEAFGLLNENDNECKDCAKTSQDLYSKCEFYHGEFKNESDKECS